MNEKKFVIATIVVTVLIVVGAVVFIGKSEANKPSVALTEDVNVEVGETSYDWGTIKLSGGDAVKTFDIKNTGTTALKLYNVSTSCMCTTAQVLIDETKSPFFGMHQKSSWMGEVAPGKVATLSVVFDPDFHGPQGVGDISRQVTVATNDKSQPTLTFNLTAKVVN